MKKLVELDAALEGLENLNAVSFYEANEHSKEAYMETKDMLKALPTVDAVPVVHSEWIPKEKADTPYWLEMECAKCGFSVIVNDALYFKFCPNCGAKMNEEDNEGTD